MNADGDQPLDEGGGDPDPARGHPYRVPFAADGTLSADGQPVAKIGPSSRSRTRPRFSRGRHARIATTAIRSRWRTGACFRASKNERHPSPDRAHGRGAARSTNTAKLDGPRGRADPVRKGARVKRDDPTEEWSECALNIAATGMAAQQMRVEVISNNLEHEHHRLSTAAGGVRPGPALPAGRAAGHDQLTEGNGAAGRCAARLGVRAGASPSRCSRARCSRLRARRSAIEGPGYLEVTLLNGDTAYTCDGALKRNGDGEIVTRRFSGWRRGSLPRGRHRSRRSIPPARSMLISMARPGAAARPVQSVTVPSSTIRGSRRWDRTQFKGTEAPGSPDRGRGGSEDGRHGAPGYLEASPVDAVREITGLDDSSAAR